MAHTATASWPAAQLSAAFDALVRAARIGSLPKDGPGLPLRGLSDDSPDAVIARHAARFNLESSPVDIGYSEVEHALRMAAPALVAFANAAGETEWLAIVESTRHTIDVIAPSGERHHMATALAATWIRQPAETPFETAAGAVLRDAGVNRDRWWAARRSMLNAHLSSAVVSRCWLLRLVPAASFWQHMRHTQLPRRAAGFLLAYAGAAIASLTAWAIIGRAALNGTVEGGTLVVWVLLLFGLVPLSLVAMWSQGIFMLGIGGLLKLQLFAGALSLDPQTTRHQGTGHHLARVLESNAVESLSLTGGFYAVAATIDLAVAIFVLALLGQVLQLSLLLIALAATAACAMSYYYRRRDWTEARLQITHQLVERMMGHRTRIVQDAGRSSQEDEDDGLERYVGVSRRMDRAATLLNAMPRAGLILGLASSVTIVGAEFTSPWIALSLGVTLLAYTALTKLVISISAIVNARIAWQQVRPLIDALHADSDPTGDPAVIPSAVSNDRASSGPLVEARDLMFQFEGRASPVLRGCTFQINSGDRIHLSGASGGGKSTLVSLLTGLRAPDSGLLLLNGLDRGTLGHSGWRQRVAGAPQFHENHVFSDSLAFNLLMGCRWPPAPEDLTRADTVCRRLGLGDLLDRMPNGLFQLVGETGWQLSHGERSRLYMARALLQRADLVVLDESFAELDPESHDRCLQVAAALSKTLIVVAHT